MKRILLFTVLMLTGCYTTQTITYQVNISSTISTTEAPQTTGVVCSDAGVVDLKDYRLPPLPTLSHLNEDDARGIVDVLIEHIAKLRSDLVGLSRDYGCAKPPQ